MSVPTATALRDFTSTLLATLPKAVKRTMAGQYEQLMSASQGCTGCTCFFVGHEVYFKDQKVYSAKQVPGTAPALPDALMPLFMAWKEPVAAMEKNLSSISQTLHSILLRATSWQDVRNMIPDHFIQPMLTHWDMEGLQRTERDLQDPAASWEPRLLQMYAQVAGKIDLCLGYKLL